MQKEPLRIFISHSSQDLPFTEKLAQDLRIALGDPEGVWYDFSNLSGGESWWPTILTKMRQSNICLVVCSPDAMKSHWVDDEINIAWGLRNKDRLFRLIPLLYQPCGLRPDLDTLQYISFLEPIPYTEAFQKLLTTLGTGSVVRRERQEHISIVPDANEGRIDLEQLDRTSSTSEFFTKRFSRRAILGGVAGLTGAVAVSAFVWQSRQWFVSASSSHSGTSSQRMTSVPSNPTSTSLQRLEADPHVFSLTVDINGLLNNSSQAINAVKQQVKGQSTLQGRSVGMTTAYGGAPIDGDVAQALQVASKVYEILRLLGQEGFAFQRSSYNEPLYRLGDSPDHVTIDVYLFVR